MKKIALLIASLFLFMTPLCHAQGYENQVSVMMEVIPEPSYSQLETGKNYTFQLTITNNNLTLNKGDPVSSPDFLFSGNLIVVVDLTLGKSGVIKYGTNKMIYGVPFREWTVSSMIQLPEKGGRSNASFTYSFNQAYSPNNATLDEWLRLLIGAKIYLEVYRAEEELMENKTYQYGPEIADFESDYFYIINDEKISYVKEKISELENELMSAISYSDMLENKTGLNWNLDFSDPLNDYYEIKNLFDRGDYVSAMNATEHWLYDPRQKLIELLMSNLDQYIDYRIIATQYEEARLQYSDMIYAKELEITQLQEADQLYKYAVIGLSALCVGLFFLWRLSGKNQGEDILSRARLVLDDKW